MKRSNKGLIVLVIILIVALLGMSVYLLYDKVFSKNGSEEKNADDKTNNNEILNKEVDVNSDLVTSLVYPNSNSAELIVPHTFVLKGESVDSYNLSYKIAALIGRDGSISTLDCYSDGNKNFSLTAKDGFALTSCSKYNADEIKNKFVKLYGPDTKYAPQKLEQVGCGYPEIYDSETNSYYGFTACGGAYPTIDSIRKTYKAELKDEYLYVYDYALISYEEVTVNGVRLFDNYESFEDYLNNGNESAVLYTVLNQSEAKAELQKLIDSNKASTYIWTFKKQSDGNYYYYSSNWE